MYWTDWGTVAKIERASMDGSGRTILHSTELVWPNGLTIDYNSQILYWVDAFLDKLESSNVDGSNRRLLSTTHIYHPFGIVVYQNTLYWTDWQLNAVLFAPLSQPQNVGAVFSGLLLDPQGIHAACADRQPPGIGINCTIMLAPFKFASVPQHTIHVPCPMVAAPISAC